MHVVEHPSPEAFFLRAGAWLAEAEAEHGAFFVICGRLAPPSPGGPPLVHLLTVEDGGAVVAAALQTPPRKWVVSRAPAAAVHALVDHLATGGWKVPGLLGPVAVVERFERLWRERTGAASRAGKSQRIWEVRAVLAPRPVAGRRRLATANDLETALAWARAFAVDAAVDETPADVATLMSSRLAEGQVHLWEDGRPVSLAAVSHATPTGLGVNLVYTPPVERGKGYASALVSAVSAEALAGDRRFCFLFTDLANPISNHVYEKIGYRPVADWTDRFFA
jgi:predicted GNAT family acetyltransferase